MKVKHKYLFWKEYPAEYKFIFSFLELEIYQHNILLSLSKGAYDNSLDEQYFAHREPFLKQRTSQCFKNQFLKKILDVETKGVGKFFEDPWRLALVYSHDLIPEPIDIIKIIFGLPRRLGKYYGATSLETLKEYNINLCRQEWEGIREKLCTICRYKDICYILRQVDEDQPAKWRPLHEIDAATIIRKTYENDDIL